MQKGDKCITTHEGLKVYSGDRTFILPANKVFTYVETDKYENIWVNVDGSDYRLVPDAGTGDYFRKLPYPIVKPLSIREFRYFIKQIVGDMEIELGVRDISIEATNSNVTIHIGEG